MYVDGTVTEKQTEDKVKTRTRTGNTTQTNLSSSQFSPPERQINLKEKF